MEYFHVGVKGLDQDLNNGYVLTEMEHFRYSYSF